MQRKLQTGGLVSRHWLQSSKPAAGVCMQDSWYITDNQLSHACTSRNKHCKHPYLENDCSSRSDSLLFCAK